MLRVGNGKRRKTDGRKTVWDILKKRGFVPPGYNYCGPFNSLDNGKPTNNADAACQLHDKAYKELQDKGEDVYMTYHDADETLLKAIEGKKGFVPSAARAWFGGKRKAADWGLIPNKRTRGETLQTPDTEPRRQRQSLRGTKSTLQQSHSSNIERVRKQLRNDIKTKRRLFEEQETMSEGGEGKPGRNVKQETPLDDVYNVTRGPPDYTFATLPYYMDFTVGQGAAFSIDFAWRMTSPYDCRVDNNSPVDWNSGAGQMNTHGVNPTNSTDVITSKAMWWDMYADMYKYYSVIGCRYEIFIENQGEPIWVYKMFYNDDLPPVTATNIDMQYWQGVDCEWLNAQWTSVSAGWTVDSELKSQAPTGGENDESMTEADAGSGAAAPAEVNRFNSSNNVTSRGAGHRTTFKGEYRPGDFKRDIVLDDRAETWTLTSTNPALPERLLIRLKSQSNAVPAGGTNASNQGDDIKARIICKLEYLVEFKDLKGGLKYPLQQQPVRITIQNSSFTK